jgi:hypothetical protein
MADAIEGIRNPSEKLDWFWQGADIREGNEENYTNAFEWFMVVVKLLLDLPPDSPLDIAVRLMKTRTAPTDAVRIGAYDYLIKPAHKDLLYDQDEEGRTGSYHPRPVETPTGELVNEEDAY